MRNAQRLQVGQATPRRRQSSRDGVLVQKAGSARGVYISEECVRPFRRLELRDAQEHKAVQAPQRVWKRPGQVVGG